MRCNLREFGTKMEILLYVSSTGSCFICKEFQFGDSHRRSFPFLPLILANCTMFWFNSFSYLILMLWPLSIDVDNRHAPTNSWVGTYIIVCGRGRLISMVLFISNCHRYPLKASEEWKAIIYCHPTLPDSASDPNSNYWEVHNECHWKLQPESEWEWLVWKIHNTHSCYVGWKRVCFWNP